MDRSDNSKSMELIKGLTLALVFSSISIIAMWLDARPIWIGLPIMFVLIAVSGLTGGWKVGVLTGLISTCLGLYVKIFHYYIPAKWLVSTEGMTPEAAEKITKGLDKFVKSANAFGETLVQNAVWIIAAGVVVGFVLGLLKNVLAEKFSSHHKIVVFVMTVVAAFVLDIQYLNSSFMFGSILVTMIVLFLSGAYLGPVLAGMMGLVTTGLILLSRANSVMHALPADQQSEAYVKMAAFHESLLHFFWLYLLAGVAVALLGAFLGRYLKNRVKIAETISKNMTYISAFVALGVVINTMRIGEISFGGFPIVYSGIAFGPIVGGVVGTLIDVVGFIVRPSGSGGAFNPLFTMTSMLTGVIPPLVMKILRDDGTKTSYWRVLISILAAQLITSVALVPLFRYWLYAHPYIPTLISSVIKQAYSVPLYAFFFVVIYRTTKKHGGIRIGAK